MGLVLLDVHLISIDCSAVSAVRVAAMDELPSSEVIFRLSEKGRGQLDSGCRRALSDSDLSAPAPVGQAGVWQHR